MKSDVRKARNLFVSVLGQYIETGRTEIIRTTPNICSIFTNCLNIAGISDLLFLVKSKNKLKELFTEYPEYSGNNLYPVKGTKGNNPAYSYEKHAFYQFWIWEYGNNRRELAIYLLKNVDKLFDIENVK